MKTNLIGISGKIGSGKDTLGIIIQYLSSRNKLTGSQKEYLKDLNYLSHILNKKSNYNVKKFADKLKDIACLLIGCTREQLEDREFKEKELGEEWWCYKGEQTNRLFPYNTPYEANKKLPLIKLTPRKLLQLLGTECGRDIIHPNIWVNALFADYNSKFTPCKQWRKDRKSINCMCGGVNAMGENKGITLCETEVKPPNWIITDVRFPNEAKAIKDRGGIVIRVSRDSELEYKHTDESVLSLLNQMGYKDIDDDFSEEAINEGFRWSKTLQKWSFDEDNFQEHPSETALDDYEFDAFIDNNGSIEELVEKVKQLKLV